MDTLLNSLGLSDPLAVLMACAWLALLMGHAGVSKLRDRSFFEQHLAAYRVPDALLARLKLKAHRHGVPYQSYIRTVVARDVARD